MCSNMSIVLFYSQWLSAFMWIIWLIYIYNISIIHVWNTSNTNADIFCLLKGNLSPHHCCVVFAHLMTKFTHNKSIWFRPAPCVSCCETPVGNGCSTSKTERNSLQNRVILIIHIWCNCNWTCKCNVYYMNVCFHWGKTRDSIIHKVIQVS